MSAITDVFSNLRGGDSGAFIPFFCAGYPDTETAALLIAAAEQSGADIVEVGVPFSDPIADGPTIQAAYTAALSAGFHVEEVFSMMRSLRESGVLSVPAVMMLSVTLVEHYGYVEFCKSARESGYDGLIVPDCPVDRWGRLEADAQGAGLDLIALLAPNTRAERRRLTAEKATGFIYQMSVTGITGARDELPSGLADCISELRKFTDTPIAVGFGISKPEHVRRVCETADGAIVGSAVVKMVKQGLADGASTAKIIRTVSKFISEMASAAHGRL